MILKYVARMIYFINKLNIILIIISNSENEMKATFSVYNLKKKYFKKIRMITKLVCTVYTINRTCQIYLSIFPSGNFLMSYDPLSIKLVEVIVI